MAKTEPPPLYHHRHRPTVPRIANRSNTADSQAESSTRSQAQASPKSTTTVPGDTSITLVRIAFTAATISPSVPATPLDAMKETRTVHFAENTKPSPNKAIKLSSSTSLKGNSHSASPKLTTPHNQQAPNNLLMRVPPLSELPDHYQAIVKLIDRHTADRRARLLACLRWHKGIDADWKSLPVFPYGDEDFDPRPLRRGRKFATIAEEDVVPAGFRPPVKRPAMRSAKAETVRGK